MARHISDFKKDSFHIVLDLVNEQNGVSLTDRQVDITHTGTGDAKPTVMHVASKRGSGYRGNVDLDYNRILLAEIPNLAEDVIAVEDINSGQILEDINLRYGVNISSEEVTVDGADATDTTSPINVGFDEITEVDISALGNKSLVWVGNVKVKYTKLTQLLAEVWQLTNLDGLYPPKSIDPRENYAMGQMLVMRGGFTLNEQAYGPTSATPARDMFDITHQAFAGDLSMIVFAYLVDSLNVPLPLEQQPLVWEGEYMTSFTPWEQLAPSASSIAQLFGVTVVPGMCMCQLQMPADMRPQQNWITSIQTPDEMFKIHLQGQRVSFYTEFTPYKVYIEYDTGLSPISEEADRENGSVRDIIRIAPYTPEGMATVQTATELTMIDDIATGPLTIVKDPTRTSRYRYGRLVMECVVKSYATDSSELEFIIGRNESNGSITVLQSQTNDGGLRVRIMSKETLMCEYDGQGNPVQVRYTDNSYIAPAGEGIELTQMFAGALPADDFQNLVYGMRINGLATTMAVAMNPAFERDAYDGAEHYFSLQLQSAE